jgi:nucleoside-diphosphate-sugar epimerase
MTKTIFVAGATGVLGRPTVQALVEAGYSVRAVARVRATR